MVRERPRPHPVGAVNHLRVLGGTLATMTVVIGALVAARTLDRTGWPAVMSLSLGLLVVPLAAAVIEWYVHRFVYHVPAIRGLRRIFVVHTAHHFAFFPTWRYVTNGPARRLSLRRHHPEAHSSGVRNAVVRSTHFVWYMSIGALLIWWPAWIVARNPVFLVGVVIASAIVSNLFIVVHDTIHRPGSHRLVEAQPWFDFLDRHHYIHHVDLGANLNFLLPLGDLIFGTLRTSLTAAELAEHGSLDAAKTAVVGHGGRAAVDLVVAR